MEQLEQLAKGPNVTSIIKKRKVAFIFQNVTVE